MQYDDEDDDTFGNPLMKRPTWLNQLGIVDQPKGVPDTHNTRQRTGTAADISLDFSMKNLTPLQLAKPKLLTIMRCVLAANTQICAVNICFCIYYGYLVSMSKVFNSHEIWQACFVRAGRFEKEDDKSFINCGSAIGLQVTVYSLAATGLVMHALQHQALLPSTIPMVIYDLLAMTSFYSLQHTLPWPTQLEGTIVTMTKYVHPNMYEPLKMGNICDGAFRFNAMYLAINYLNVLCVLIVLGVVLYADYLRKLALPKARVGRLVATEWPIRFSRIILFGYVVQLVGKNISALLAIDTFQNTLAPTYFPGSPPSLDPTTIFLVITAMAVIRGNLACSSSAFRLGAATGVLYLATTYPGFVGAMTAVFQYNIFTEAGCQTFFKGQTAWGVPNAHQADIFCYATRTSVIGEATIFLTMHCQVIACILCFSANRTRDMGMFNLAAPENAQDLLFSRSTTATLGDSSKDTKDSSSASKLSYSKSDKSKSVGLSSSNSKGKASSGKMGGRSISDQINASPNPQAPGQYQFPPPTSSYQAGISRSYSEQPHGMYHHQQQQQQQQQSSHSSPWDDMFKNDFGSGGNHASTTSFDDISQTSSLNRHSSGGSSGGILTRNSSGGSSGGFSGGGGVMRRASAPAQQSPYEERYYQRPHTGSTTSVKAMRTNRRDRTGGQAKRSSSSTSTLPTIDANSSVNMGDVRNIDSRLLQTGFE